MIQQPNRRREKTKSVFLLILFSCAKWICTVSFGIKRMQSNKRKRLANTKGPIVVKKKERESPYLVKRKRFCGLPNGVAILPRLAAIV